MSLSLSLFNNCSYFSSSDIEVFSNNSFSDSVIFIRLTRASLGLISYSTSPIFSIGINMRVTPEAVRPKASVRSILRRVILGGFI